MINDLIETLLLEKDQIKNEKSDEAVIFKPSNNLRNRLRIDNSLPDCSLEVPEVSSANHEPNSDQGSSIDERLRSLQQIRNHDFVQAINPIYLLDSIFAILKILLTSCDCEYAMSQNALRLMEQIDRVDENLKNLGIQIDYRRLFRHVKIVGLFWLLNAIIILGIFITWDDERNTKESSEEIIFKPSSNFRNRLEIDCSMSARPSEVSQISSMNDTSNFKKGSPTDEKLRLFQQIRSLHLQVCSVSKLVNQMFNVQILIYTFTTLVYISISTYWIYMEVQRKTNVVKMLDLVLIFFWLGLRFKMINELLKTFLSEDDQLNSEESSEEVVFKPSNNFRNRLQIDNCSSSRSLEVSTSSTNDTSNFKKGLTIDEKIHLFQRISWLGSRFKMINQLLKTLLPEDDERNTKESSEEIICKPSSNFRNRLEIDCSMSARPSEVSQISSMNDTSNFKKGSPTDEKLRLFQQIRKSNLKLVLTIVYLLDSIIGVLKIALMSIDCEYVMRQADKIISLIHACPLYRESAELKNETLQFLWQISYTQLEDTKSVHYVLNYSFVRNCFYFVLTYLVIMVQLSQNLAVTDQTTVTYETSSFQTVLQKNANIA
ncbi:hypothetical protein WN51_01306 [Melipona quadrifasciata]|uniref:Gustatory receptor n=1 Tax=Melipona quadrifasciata TaxID=166423 RepID=A0A0M9A0S1_9HYME|nr:hypothetical protein WN51_01306 [Melipona quadrifasciata]